MIGSPGLHGSGVVMIDLDVYLLGCVMQRGGLRNEQDVKVRVFFFFLGCMERLEEFA